LQALGARLDTIDRAGKATSAALAAIKEPAALTAARLAIVATALKAAVDRGTPYAAELAAVRGLADAKTTEPLAAFAATGVPSASALAGEFATLAPKLLASANVAPADTSILGRLQANAEKLVRVRPVNDVQGDDAGAIVSRIETRSARGDIAGAVTEAEKLPPPTRDLAAAWIAKAQARVAAIEAAGRLATSSLAAVGGNASQGSAP
jgi:hypothetical protein